MAGPSQDDLQFSEPELLDQIGVNPLEPTDSTNAITIDNPLATEAVNYTEGAGATNQTPDQATIGGQPSVLMTFVAWLEGLLKKL